MTGFAFIICPLLLGMYIRYKCRVTIEKVVKFFKYKEENK